MVVIKEQKRNLFFSYEHTKLLFSIKAKAYALPLNICKNKSSVKLTEKCYVHHPAIGQMQCIFFLLKREGKALLILLMKKLQNTGRKSIKHD
jgi:hypothetical protein